VDPSWQLPIWYQCSSLRWALMPFLTRRLASISGRGEGRIRLSEDDGPASHEFIVDDDDTPHDGEVLGVGDEQRVWRRDA